MARIKSTWNEKYTLIKEKIGEGGNAIVHLISDVNGNNFAIKVLNNFSEEKKARFMDEIKIMYDNSDLSSVMDIIDFSYEEYWYVMPVADSISKVFTRSIIENEFESIQDILISLASALLEIHSRNLAHRDIKPDNIYILNENVCFGDFGLVDFPDNPHEFTRSDKGLGAIFTIAPEMKRDPKHADGKKADVYSLAKTIWILLSGEGKGFDGQYLVNGEYSLRNNDYLRGKHLVELENLLQRATSFDPDLRPTVEQFVAELQYWKEISGDSERYQISEWNFLNKCLFEDTILETAIWSERDSIIKVLNVISSLPVLNHMLFSTKGGLDFKRAKETTEEGCIEINDDYGWTYILKPKKLYFERFCDPSWNYFLLEMDRLNPIFSNLNDNSEIHKEDLVEDVPGHYISALYVQYGVYDYDTGEKLPDGYREVFRFTDGALLFVMKSGFYNSINSTYDGRHGMCHPLNFRLYTEKLCELTEELKTRGLNSKEIKHFLNCSRFSNNPFNNDSESNEDFDNNNERQNDTEDCSSYTKKHLLEWSFGDITDGIRIAEEKECKVLYYIEYQDNEFILSHILDNERFGSFLCVDGFFRQKCDNKQILYVDSMKIISTILERLQQKIKELCDDAGLIDCGYCHYPNINIFRGKEKPSHLFTESEIRNLMRVADDRHRNTLVVNYDGYARLIIDNENEDIFPVYTESWEAGNNYVGKYSDLADCKSAYLRALNGWLRYLKTGRKQYIDYSEEEREEELLSSIQEFY